jgi:hypothetical protein
MPCHVELGQRENQPSSPVGCVDTTAEGPAGRGQRLQQQTARALLEFEFEAACLAILLMKSVSSSSSKNLCWPALRTCIFFFSLFYLVIRLQRLRVSLERFLVKKDQNDTLQAVLRIVQMSCDLSQRNRRGLIEPVAVDPVLIDGKLM